MSFILMAKAVAVELTDPLAKWLLVVLADHANEETHKCFPSLDRLAERTQMSRVTVTRKLNLLEDINFISRNRGSSKRSTIYTIFPDTVAHSNRPVAESNPNLSIKPINNIVGYKPNDTLINTISLQGELDHEHETNQFIDFHLAKGTKFKDVDRGYRYWCSNRIKWDAKRKSTDSSTGSRKSYAGRQKSNIFDGIYNKIRSESE
jgi:hypothetical protein